MSDIKFRMSQWMDTSDDNAKEYPMLYGVQANMGNGWRHCHEDGEALIFDNMKEADKKIDELRLKSWEKSDE